MCPYRNWHQKYPRVNWWSTWLVEQRSLRRTCKWLLCRGYRVIGESSQESKCVATSSYVLEPCLTWKIAHGHHICLLTGVRRGGVLTKELAIYKTCVIEETIETVLAKTNQHSKNPTVLHWRCMKKYLFLFPLILQRMWLDWLYVNCWGARIPVSPTQRIHMDG